MQKLNVHSLKRGLNMLCEELDSEYFINSGGCCYVAYLIAYYLEKLNVKYNFVVFNDEIKDSKSIQLEIINKRKNKKEADYYSVVGKGTCSHYAICINGTTINISDFADYNYYTIKRITSNNILWIYRNGHWNSEYNRKNNKLVRKILKEFFKKYL